MGGKGNAKGTNGKGKHTYTGGNRGGGAAKTLTDIIGGSSDDDSDDDPLLSLIAGDDGKVEGATRKLALAAFLKKKEGSLAAPVLQKLRSPKPNSQRSKR